MARVVAVLVCLALIGCTTTRWSSLVTFQPVCAAGAACPAPIEEKRDGKCVEQTDDPGFRIVGCVPSPEKRINGTGVLVGTLGVAGAVGLLYGIYLLGMGSALAHTH